MVRLQNPTNGYIEEFPWLRLKGLLFGPLYSAGLGLWGDAIRFCLWLIGGAFFAIAMVAGAPEVNLGLMFLAIVGGLWVAHALSLPSIVEKHYQRKGWNLLE